MSKKLLICALVALAGASTAPATHAQQIEGDTTRLFKVHKSRLSIGGYGEAVMSKNFYSDSYLRYTDPSSVKDQSHGRVDLPHVVIFLGYDFGKGWSMSSEIEFEHGGTESAVEIETEEAGEYESEIERGGEVALEQFWIQKSFMPQLNVRAGMMVVPVGQTNSHHMPTEFFGVYRPEGENTIFPCTWHEVGISVWGKAGHWRYEAMLLPGLDSERFGNDSWIHYGSASPYEFKIANNVAVAARVDNTSVPGLRISASGYVGNSFRNTLYPTNNSKNDGVHGTVTIGSVDFQYKGHGFLARGNFDYGHLSDSKRISDFNISMPKTSVSKRQKVASDVIATGVEAGYDFLGLCDKYRNSGKNLYLFGRYEYYDSMYKMERDTKEEWCGRQRVAVGLNYFPMPQIVVKGEYSIGILKSRYNNEPSVSIGIAYTGWFI
jgi:hypothetical protein